MTPTPSVFPFIVGVGRSGTTLLRLMIDAHPRIAIPPETHWLGRAIATLRADPGDADGLRAAIVVDPRWADLGIAGPDLDAIIAGHVAAHPYDSLRRIYDVYRRRHGAEIVGDKTPNHLLQMGEILEAFPDARFIHIIRDGRDVALSYRDLWFGPGKDVRAAADFWVQRIQRAREQSRTLPHYLEIRYEELVLDAERVLRTVGQFIGVPFDPRQLSYFADAERRLGEFRDLQGLENLSAEKRRAIHKLTTRPPDPDRVAAWRTEMAASEVAMFNDVAGALLSDLGYPLR